MLYTTTTYMALNTTLGNNKRLALLFTIPQKLCCFLVKVSANKYPEQNTNNSKRNALHNVAIQS